MSQRGDTIAHRIKAFVEHPVTNLVKGVALLLIGVSEASHTFQEDIMHGRVHVGHGLAIIGFFSILCALPNLIDSMEAGLRYRELRAQKAQAREKADKP
jgi:hypothetical protein